MRRASLAGHEGGARIEALLDRVSPAVPAHAVGAMARVLVEGAARRGERLATRPARVGSPVHADLRAGDAPSAVTTREGRGHERGATASPARRATAAAVARRHREKRGNRQHDGTNQCVSHHRRPRCPDSTPVLPRTHRVRASRAGGGGPVRRASSGPEARNGATTGAQRRGVTLGLGDLP